MLTGHRAVDLITEIERWRRRRGIGFESWRHRIVFRRGKTCGAPDYRAIDVLRLVYDAHVAFERSRREGTTWVKPFNGDDYHLTAATVAARLNLKKGTAADVLRRLEELGYIRKRLERNRRPYVTPDPVRIGEITFPVGAVADHHGRVSAALHEEDAAVHHLLRTRPGDVGGWVGTDPINLLKDYGLAGSEETEPLPAVGSPSCVTLPPPSRQPPIPATDPGEGVAVRHAQPGSPPFLGPRGHEVGGENVDATDLIEGEGSGCGDGYGGAGNGEARSVSDLDALDALSILWLGWEGFEAEEDELERLATSYPYRARPHPLQEAHSAHRTVLHRHAEDPDRERRTGLTPNEEAGELRTIVYAESAGRLRDDLLRRYDAKREDGSPVGTALGGVLTHFSARFLPETLHGESLFMNVNLLVGKLKTWTLARLAEDELGVEPARRGEFEAYNTLTEEAARAVKDYEEAWHRDEGIQAKKDAWARERIEELVRLSFTLGYDVQEDLDSIHGVEHRQRSGRSERVATRNPLGDELMMPELIDVWKRLGLRQLGQIDGCPTYGGPRDAR